MRRTRAGPALDMSARAWLPVLASGALLALAAAAVPFRCSELVEGVLDGELHALEPEVLQPHERRHVFFTPILENCGARAARGLVVTACDVLPPQLELDLTHDSEWGRVRVLRLGPIWAPLLLEFTLYCEPHAPAKPHHTVAAERNSSTATEPRVTPAELRATTAKVSVKKTRPSGPTV